MSDSTKARLCLQSLVELFKSGTVPKALAIATIPPQAGIPSAKWSWSNRLLQFMADTSDARGFRQWQEAGRSVKKGSKALHILGPCVKKVSKTDETGQKTDKMVVIGFHAIPVFRVEDTDSAPLPYEPASPPPLADVAERLGLTLSYQTFSGKFYGAYRQDGKILLATHEAQTFFHELAHAAHHHIAGRLQGGQVPSQEIIAELTAATLASLYCPQANNAGFSYQYVESYAAKSKKTVERACLSVIHTVGQVLDVILGAHAQGEEQAA